MLTIDSGFFPTPSRGVMPPLAGYRVLTFDCYGTLIDWESGIWDALQPLILHNGSDDVTRNRALHTFAECESRQQKATPELHYLELLTRVHRLIARSLGLKTTHDLDEAFGASLPHWPAFPDSADSLRTLRHFFQLVILSNVHREGIATSIRKLGVPFDAIYTAEDIGSYKPSDANFDYLLTHLKADLGLERQDILHTAQSLYHDHIPARRFGLANVWIDRQRLSKGGSWGATARVDAPPTTDFVFFSMAEMAAAASADIHLPQ